jgi:hypothetical protein
MGYSLGNSKYSFTGNYGSKGCYAYKTGNHAKSGFYGTINGGPVSSPSQVAPFPPSKSYFRPIGYGDTCGENFVKSDKIHLSVDECAKLCDENSTCAAFEYGNGRGSYKKGECILQSTNFATTCKG